MTDLLEDMENSFISDSSIITVDFIEEYEKDRRLFFRMQSLDGRFVKSMAYVELTRRDPRLLHRAIRFNIYNTFFRFFNENTINALFNLTIEHTLSGLMRGMLFLINESAIQRHYSIKRTLVEFIINDIVVHITPSRPYVTWEVFKVNVVPLFNPDVWAVYFKEKEDTYKHPDCRLVIH